MNRTDAPQKQAVPFALNGQREAILSETPPGDNRASYKDGFPPITMTLKSAGGLPPKGQDMNQILYELSGLARWTSTGALNTFDASFASSIGGYPSGAYVLGDDLKTVYRCTTNGNTGNPNITTTGWAKLAQDVADILQLGSAAFRSVGTGTNQIPDMNSFVSSFVQNGYFKLPGGLIIQWGEVTTSTTATAPANFAIPFPHALLSMSSLLDWTNAGYANVQSQTNVGFSANAWSSSGARVGLAIRYIAVGW
mgnify:CR=1 FL=1